MAWMHANFNTQIVDPVIDFIFWMENANLMIWPQEFGALNYFLHKYSYTFRVY